MEINEYISRIKKTAANATKTMNHLLTMLGVLVLNTALWVGIIWVVRICL